MKSQQEKQFACTEPLLKRLPVYLSMLEKA